MGEEEEVGKGRLKDEERRYLLPPRHSQLTCLEPQSGRKISPCCGLETGTLALQEIYPHGVQSQCWDIDSELLGPVSHVHGDNLDGVHLGKTDGDFTRAGALSCLS